MSSRNPLPVLRAVDITPVANDDGGTQFILSDRMGIAPQQVVVSLPGYLILMHLDGESTSADVQAAFREQFGQSIPMREIMHLVDVLDHALLLENERFEDVLFDRRRQFAESPTRDNRDRWPDASTLQSTLQESLAGGLVAQPDVVRAIIAPHLDYERGKSCYADAYAALRAAGPADRYVILGTNHFGRGRGIVATAKDFQTPLGIVRTDRDFLRLLEHGLAQSICADELDHDREHSIELHVHLLQAVFPAVPFMIVPILVPDPSAPPELTGDVHGRVREFSTELRRLIDSDGRRTVVVASADWSHVGQRFGDESKTTPEFLREIEAYDREAMSLLRGGDADGFVHFVRANQNATRICSVGNLFAAAAVFPDGRLNWLRYHQAVDFENETHVTATAGLIVV